jgi:hypothetical protein
MRPWPRWLHHARSVACQPWAAPVALLLLGLLYSSSYLGLSARWWFEDDPFLFDHASQLADPSTAFAEPEVLRHFTGGRALVPMQILSYWIDVQFPAFSPGFAYAHQMGSFLLALLLLYLVLLPVFRYDKIATFTLCGIWLLLPSTAVVVQFLATRHYLEGMVFLLAATCVLQRFRSSDGRLSGATRAAVLFLACASLLCKEIYVPVAAVLLLANSQRHRDYALGASTLGLLVLYAGYRTLMIGPQVDYAIPFLTAPQYLKFITKLPYTITANYGGYGVLGVLIVLGSLFLWRRQGCHKAMFWFLAAMALSLAAIVPVSFPLYGSIRRPDPWYRILFVLNTLLLCFGGWLAVRCEVRLRIAAACVVLLALVPGAEKTRRLWSDLTASAEREGRFYLDNPGKVLLSEQEASWFIPGIHQMYKVKTTHYVLLKDFEAGRVSNGMILSRYRNGAFEPFEAHGDRVVP